MSTDALADAIAVEEHRQGRPYLADPEHCERCAEVDQAWWEAELRERLGPLRAFGITSGGLPVFFDPTLIVEDA